MFSSKTKSLEKGNCHVSKEVLPYFDSPDSECHDTVLHLLFINGNGADAKPIDKSVTRIS